MPEISCTTVPVATQVNFPRFIWKVTHDPHSLSLGHISKTVLCQAYQQRGMLVLAPELLQQRLGIL
jgi:hypothetical protein